MTCMVRDRNSIQSPQSMQRDDLARMIDHTALKPETTAADIERLCSEAVRYGFATVCVMPWWVPSALSHLSTNRSSHPPVCTVVGFPIGAHREEVKAFEAERSMEDGASEIDMVMNIGAFLSGEPKVVADEIELLARLVRSGSGRLKVIIETCLLNTGQIVEACRIAAGSGADFVKTSTGFSSAGATADGVRLMRDSLPDHVAVKASGGIRTAADALRMVESGASRIGTSGSAGIIESLSEV